MAGQRHTAEQIVGRLPEAEVLQGKGLSIEEMFLAAWDQRRPERTTRALPS
jgi:hypothetical protein